MLAYGVLLTGNGAYLKDPWCQLDFAVVSLGWMPILFPSFGNYSAIRAVRALRPLRALKRVPGMPMLVESILAALPRVGNVLFLCLFIFLVFAIVGVETFQGFLHYRCARSGFTETPGHPSLEDLATPAVAAGGDAGVGSARALAALEPFGAALALGARQLKGSSQQGGFDGEQSQWDTGVACNPALPDEPQCASGESCLYFDRNPSHDLMSFDNVPVAFITLLQAITFDDWTVSMYALMDSFSPWAVIYFALIVILGGFFVINLFLAVIFEETIAAQNNQDLLNAAVKLGARLEEERMAMAAFAPAGAPSAAPSPTRSPARSPAPNPAPNPAPSGIGTRHLDTIHEHVEDPDQRAERLRRETEKKLLLTDPDGPSLAELRAALNGAKIAIVDPILSPRLTIRSPEKSPEKTGESASLLPARHVASDAPADATKAPAGGFGAAAKERATAPAAASYAPAPVPPVDLEAGGDKRGGAAAYRALPVEEGGSVPIRGDPMRACVKRLVDASYFSTASMLLVLANMALMCMPYNGMSEERRVWIEEMGSRITWIFIWEMVLKLYAYGCTGYWSEGWNQLDGTIVIMSVVEMVLTAVFAGSGVKLSFLRILRMLRVTRMLRLMRSWKGLYKIVTTFIKALPQMMNISILMLVFMVIFSLLGMQIFGGQFTPDRGFSREPCPPAGCADPTLLPEPRFHFDYFVPAAMTVFVLMTGEWVDAMDPGIAAIGPVGSVYYAGVVLFGRYLIINLLVAIVLNAFADDSEDEEVSLEDELHGAITKANDSPGPTRRASIRRASSRSRDNSPERAENGTTVVIASELEAGLEGEDGRREPEWPRDYSLCCFSPLSPFRRGSLTLVQLPAFDTFVSFAIIISSICLALDTPRLDPESSLAETLYLLDLCLWPWFFLCEMLLKAIAFGFAWGRDAYLKSAWNQFDLLITVSSFVVFLTAAFPALEPLTNLRILRVLRPLRLVARDPGMKLVLSSLLKVLPEVSNVVGVVLSLQLVFAVLGMQLFMGSLAHCSNPSILTEAECIPPDAAARRALAAPAILTANATALALAPLAANASSAAWGAVTAATTTVASPVALVASATLAAANASTIAPISELAAVARRALKGNGGGKKFDASKDKVEWVNSRVGSFDSFGAAMLLLYVMSTGDEWEVHMFAMMDATEPGRAPERNDHSPAAIFSIVWMFIGSFFAMNLFVGVIVEKFNAIKAESDGTATMTQEQLQWVATMKAMAHSAPARANARAPTNPLRRSIYQLVTSQLFDACIMSVIAANIFVMACDYWGIEREPSHLNTYNRAMDYFAYVYYAEATLKIIGLGCDGYFSDAWCRFDFTLVCTSTLDMFATELLAEVLPLPPMLLRVLRIVRIVRILRLMKQFKELRNLIVTMIYSFPSLVNVGSLLALIVFMYAVLGVDLFTYLMPQDNINEDRDFFDLPHAALLLFQCLTNDAWSGLMADAMESPEMGHCSSEEGNCGSWIAVPYFISFQILGSFVFLNLVVAVILENFTSQTSGNPDLIAGPDLERFKEGWAKFDADADYYIAAWELPELILELPAPLGLQGTAEAEAGGRTAERAANIMCMRMQVPERDGDVAYLDVLEALIQHNFHQNGTDTFRAKMGGSSFRSKAEKLGVARPAAPPEKPSHLVQRQQTFKLQHSSKEEQFAQGLTLQERYSLEVIKEYARERILRIAAKRYVETYSPANPPSAQPPGGKKAPAKAVGAAKKPAGAPTATKTSPPPGGAKQGDQKRPACGKAADAKGGAKGGSSPAAAKATGGAAATKDAATKTGGNAAAKADGAAAKKGGAGAKLVGKSAGKKLAEGTAAAKAVAADAARLLTPRLSTRPNSPNKSARAKPTPVQSAVTATKEVPKPEPVADQPLVTAAAVDPTPVIAASTAAAPASLAAANPAVPVPAPSPPGGTSAAPPAMSPAVPPAYAEGRGGRGAEGGRGGRGRGRGRGAQPTSSLRAKSQVAGSAASSRPQAQSGNLPLLE